MVEIGDKIKLINKDYPEYEELNESQELRVELGYTIEELE